MLREHTTLQRRLIRQILIEALPAWNRGGIIHTRERRRGHVGMVRAGEIQAQEKGLLLPGVALQQMNRGISEQVRFGALDGKRIDAGNNHILSWKMYTDRIEHAWMPLGGHDVVHFAYHVHESARCWPQFTSNMPLAHVTHAIAGIGHELAKSRQCGGQFAKNSVIAMTIIEHAVSVWVETCQQRGARGGADPDGGIDAGKAHPLARQRVDAGRLAHRAAINANHIVTFLIADDKQKIWSFCLLCHKIYPFLESI